MSVYIGNGHRGSFFESCPLSSLGSEFSGFLADRVNGTRHFFINDILETGIESLEKFNFRIAFPFRPHGLVTGGT